MTTNDQTSVTLVRQGAELEAARSALPATATYSREQQHMYTREQLELYKRQIAPDLSDDEAQLVLGTSKRTGLDVFSKQLYAVKRFDKHTNKKVLTIMVGIDGFRSIASRTGELDGSETHWCGPDGQWADIWLADGAPTAARTQVWRKGCSRPFVGVAKFSSYCQRRDGKPSGLWASMPDTMIAKCSEALALRRAFPLELSGLYSVDEMAQASNAEPPEPARRETRSAPRKEPEPEEPEIEIAEDWAMAVLGDVDAAETIEDLKALAPKINKMPRGSVARRACRTAYDAKLAALSQPE